METDPQKGLTPDQLGVLPEYVTGHEDHAEDIDSEFAHAADVGTWVRKLTPRPSASLLFAANFHDWERIVYPGSSTGYAGDRGTPEYLEHKKRHAERSAIWTRDMLAERGFGEELADRVGFLILHHDDVGEEIQRIGDPELQILVSADSLSYFSFIAPIMLERGDEEDQIRKKMRFMIGKMDERARAILADWESPVPRINLWKNQELEAISSQ